MTNLTLNEYKNKAMSTCMPESDNLFYISDEERHLMLSKIGDILWQTARLAKVMGVTLEEVAEETLAKLASRKQRNVIAGDGDER